MKFLYALFFLTLALLWGCSEPSAPQPLTQKDGDHEGLVKVASRGKSVELGKDIHLKALFSYDFSLGIHEVTCGEYNEFVKVNVTEDFAVGEIECSNDSLPAVNVSFFDAVLFANARSKSEGLDTVYSYVKATFDDDGHCANLSGLTFLPEVEGYRLPTEAEWVLVAKDKWNAEKSWNSSNSDFKAHKVCSSSTKTGNFCDLAGNAMEWVNDWLGDFPDTSITNYVGAPNGGGFDERVVKGGSFRNDASSINVYSRGDVYKVTSGTRSNYVGFRIAFGAIPDAIWMDADGIPYSTKIDLLASATDVHQKTRTYSTKLAFRNDVSGNLAYVDYSNGTLSVIEIADTIDSYHPEISPDGKWVAFCTGIEGVAGPSGLYVRRLDREGSRLVKLDVEYAAIPRWYVRGMDTVIVYVSGSGNNMKDETFIGQSTWEVSFAGGNFGTPKKLFDGNYHGGVSADYRLAVTGARLLRARKASGMDALPGDVTDTIWYDGYQACNASLARDDSKRTLFLDFGEGPGLEYAKSEYDVHEQLLIVDSTGSLVQMVPAPDGYAFDHAEWALGTVNSRSSLVVATLTDLDGEHRKVVLVDLADSSIIELARGVELWHPTLWIHRAYETVKNDSLDLDSAGIYAKEGDEWGPIILRYKMELLWRYGDSVNVAIMGSSRPLYSISPSLLSDEFFAVNFAHTPNSIYATRDYLDRYLWNHLKNLKYLIVSLDLDFWWKVDEPKDNFFIEDANRYPGYAYDAHHDNWRKGVPAGLLEATEDGIGSEWGFTYTEDRGRFTGLVCGSWGDTPEIENDSTYFDKRPQLFENAYGALKGIIQKAAERDVVVIGMIFPQSPGYRNTGAFGRYGLRRSLAEKWIAELEALAADDPHFVLFDENKMGNHDYTSSMAVDYDHLCTEGVAQITGRLDSLLQSLSHE